MTNSKVIVLDTGSGNLRSVVRAIRAVGGDAVLTSRPDDVRAAERIVVPGQGAFGSFVEAIAELHLEDPLRELIASGRPYFGICLGLQILYEASDESPQGRGLAILNGRCRRFDQAAGGQRKVPHMGWNRVIRAKQDPLTQGLVDPAHFYFVHSYYAVPETEDHTVLSCDYGIRFPAAIRKDNVFACQFHPEKSHHNGLRMLRSFVHEGLAT